MRFQPPYSDLQLIRLRGRAALSPFRLQKLHAALKGTLPELRVTAEFWHFAHAKRPLDAGETARLERLLTYGPKGAPAREEGVLFLVMPRVGTISPWSSKATDIARHCGLDVLDRIERGVAYWICTPRAAPLTTSERRTLQRY